MNNFMLSWVKPEKSFITLGSDSVASDQVLHRLPLIQYFLTPQQVIKWTCSNVRTCSKKLTHCILNKLSHTIYWKSPISILGMSSHEIHIPREKWLNYSQTLETLIRRCILRHLIWVCTICQVPFYRPIDYNGLWCLNIYCAFDIFQKVTFCLALYTEEVNLQTFVMI